MQQLSVSWTALPLLLFAVTVTSGDLVVELGSEEVVLAPGSGISTASFDITFRNPMTTPASLAGYSLFVDIDPAGLQLPTGVSFDDPAATYFSGMGVPPLVGAGNPGTINLTPAAGDLGLGQFQLFDGTIDPQASYKMITVHLLVDRAAASPGDFAIFLNPQGHNTLNTVGGPVPFDVVDGMLKLTPPEPADFNMDGLLDCVDVDSLVAEIVSGMNRVVFDLTGDGSVDTLDLRQWLTDAGRVNLPSGNPYPEGDANLDGSVDGSDFSVWNTNKFAGTAAWCAGDFNASGAIDGSDFSIWNTYKFTSASDAMVPEPVGGMWIIFGLLHWIARRLRQSGGRGFGGAVAPPRE